MKMKWNNLKLSGLGYKITKPVAFQMDNFKLELSECEMHEVVELSEQVERRIGWVTVGSVDIYADFTQHTNTGMRGESIHSNISDILIIDQSKLLTGLIPDSLEDLPIEEATTILEQVKKKNSHEKNFQLDEEEDHLFIFSRSPKLLFVQSSTTSIFISNRGVYVYERENNELNIINKRGITAHTESENVEINDEGIFINNKLLKFDFFDDIARQLEYAFDDLSFHSIF